VNREGKSYRSERPENRKHFSNVPAGPVNGSIVVVTRSEKWSPHLTDEQSNYTHVCLVLECPMDPTQVGREVRLDERKYQVKTSNVTGTVGYASTWTNDDGYREI